MRIPRLPCRRAMLFVGILAVLTVAASAQPPAARVPTATPASSVPHLVAQGEELAAPRVPPSPAPAAEVAALLTQIAPLLDAGQFCEAEALLSAALDEHAPAGFRTSADARAARDALAAENSAPGIALEILRRIRLDYHRTPENVLEQLRRSIPDVTVADVEGWCAAGLLQNRVIDGEVRYFDRAVSNLFLFSEEARSRRKIEPPPAGFKFDLPRHIARWIEQADAAGRQAAEPGHLVVEGGDPGGLIVLVAPTKHRVRYELRIKPDHPRLKPGATIRAWLPFPQEYRQQQGGRLISAEPGTHFISAGGTAHRTIYFEHRLAPKARSAPGSSEQADVVRVEGSPSGDSRAVALTPPAKSAKPSAEAAMPPAEPAIPPVFSVEFEFVSHAVVPRLDPGLARLYDRNSPEYREFTAERPPHILLTPAVRRLAGEIVGEETNPLLRARRIFRWVSENIPWCAEMEYSTIPSLSQKGLAARRGDCGVQGLVFVTLCRAADIPARWQSGWQTKPNSWNMHDWSEIYVEPWGWLPADASYGMQEHPDERVQYFYCGGMDPYRLIVNLDYGRELVPRKSSFRSEPNDFQRGEVEIDGDNLYYDEWEWTFRVETSPAESIEQSSAGEGAAGIEAIELAVDAVVPEALRAGKIPGAVIAVGRRKAGGGFETWQKAYGYLCTEPQPEPMVDEAVFDLASMTKPIATGTSLLMLIDQGRVGLDEPVSKYLPEFAAPRNPSPNGSEVLIAEKQNVSVRHLMTHMSGMPAYIGAGEQKKLKDAHGFPCAAAARKYLRELPLARPPGEAVVYSCLNAMLCAEIVEVVSGAPLNEFAARHVFEPLGMRDTGFLPLQANTDIAARIVPTTKTDYGRGAGGFLCGQVHDPLAALQGGVSGNAGLFSTAGDLARFAQMILSGGELDGVRVLSADMVAAATSVQNSGAVNARGRPDQRGLLWDIYPPGGAETRRPPANSRSRRPAGASRTGRGPASPRGRRPAALDNDTDGNELHVFGHTGYTGTAIRIWPEAGVYAIALANRVHPDDTGKVDDLRRAVWKTTTELLMKQSQPEAPASE